MINRRTLYLIVLSLLSAILLSACSPAAGTDNEAAATDAPDETANMDTECIIPVENDATIVFSGWGDPTEQGIYTDSIERFNEVCPNVTIDYQPIPDDFQTKVKAAMAGGTAPDVMYIDDQLMTAFATTGQLLPLDDYMAEAEVSRDDFIPALLTIFTSEGQTYALPKDWGTLGLIYLPAAFEAAGIDEPTADWTWSDLQHARSARSREFRGRAA
jgi:multiple sugar transport system substrate-binding protein